jgi:hypothetical protein
MDRSTFESADRVVGEIADNLGELIDSDHFAAIRVLLARLSETVGSRYSVNFNVCVDVFDAERSNALPLLNVGLSTSKGERRRSVTQLPRSMWSMVKFKSSRTTDVPNVTACGTSNSSTRPVRAAVRLWVEKSSFFSTTISVRSVRRGRSH